MAGLKLNNIPTERGTEGFEKENAEAEGGKIMISFTGLPSGEFKKEVALSLTVQEVKALIEADKGIPFNSIKLSFDGGKQMADPLSLSDLGISGSEITINAEISE